MTIIAGKGHNLMQGSGADATKFLTTMVALVPGLVTQQSKRIGINHTLFKFYYIWIYRSL